MVVNNIVVGQQRKYPPPSLSPSLSPSPSPSPSPHIPQPQTQIQPIQSSPMAMVVPSNVNNPVTTTATTPSIIRTKAVPTPSDTVEPTTTTSMSMSIETTPTASVFLQNPSVTATPIHTGVTINNNNSNGSEKNKNNKRKRPTPQTTSLQSTTSTETADNYNDNNEATANGTGNNTTTNSIPQQQQHEQNTTQQQQQHRVGKDGEPLSDKKIRRLEKNRLSARECRRRKREATENMQRQIHLLEGENLRLRLQLQVGEEAEQTNHQKQIDSTKVLDELVRSGKASESEIYAKIEEYKEQFADYGRDRRSAMEFHLRNIERLLMPTQTTSFIMNTLKGTITSTSTSTSSDTTTTTTNTGTTNTNSTTIDGKEVKVKSDENKEGRVSALLPTQTPTPMPMPIPSSVAAAAAIMTSPTKYDSNESPFSSVLQDAISAATSTNVATSPASASATTDAMMFMPPKNSKELFITLVKILEVTPEQAAVLKDSRFVAQEMDETLKETLICLTELRGRLAQCGHDLDTEFNCIRQILTPSQSAKFLVWVAQNKACMHMLNELWSKKYNPLLSSSTSTHSKTASTSTETSTSTKAPPSPSSSFDE